MPALCAESPVTDMPLPPEPPEPSEPALFRQCLFDRGCLAQFLNVVSLELIEIRAYDAHADDVLPVISSCLLRVATAACIAMLRIVERHHTW